MKLFNVKKFADGACLSTASTNKGTSAAFNEIAEACTEISREINSWKFTNEMV